MVRASVTFWCQKRARFFSYMQHTFYLLPLGIRYRMVLRASATFGEGKGFILEETYKKSRANPIQRPSAPVRPCIQRLQLPDFPRPTRTIPLNRRVAARNGKRGGKSLLLPKFRRYLQTMPPFPSLKSSPSPLCSLSDARLPAELLRERRG